MIKLWQSIIHPYSRYGLGVALYRKRLQVDQLDEEELKSLLAEAIEDGLGEFRMETLDAPGTSETLSYMSIKMSVLEQDNTRVQSSGLASKGIYLYPTVVSTDGDAKGTFDNSLDIIKALRQGKALDSPRNFSRSFAPTTAKINNGETRSFSEPRGTLLEAACSAITTVTPAKPAGWIGGRNTCIIPDLPLAALYDFIELFERMRTSGLDGNLWEAKLFSKVQPSQSPIKRTAKKSGEQTKSEYRRPRLHNGNYPYAPQRDAAAFGAVGLLGAIGRWAVEAEQTAWAERVLEALVDKPLYIVSYDSISQAQFGHHIVGLAKNGRLSDIVRSLTYDTRLGKEIDGGKPLWDDSNRKIFHLMVGRFLEVFTAPSFQDFLAFRTEYHSKIKPLFEEYFMKTILIDAEIVQSASEYGKWINSGAFRLIVEEIRDEERKRHDQKLPDQIKDWPDDLKRKLQKGKAQILVTLESAAMSAKDNQELLSHITTQFGRLSETQSPPATKRFMTAVLTGEIQSQDAKNLLMVFMRLQSPRERIAASPENSEDREDVAGLDLNNDRGDKNGD